MNIIPIIAIGSGALLLMSKKKRKKKATPLVEQLHAELPPMVAPPKKKKAGSTTVKKRQQSLEDTGFSVGPSGVDGKMGPDTRAAIRAFQSAIGITVDGLWGPETAAAMAQALKMALQGLSDASFRQIGKMLEKFQDTFDKFFEPGEGGEKKVAHASDEGRFSEAGAEDRETTVHAIDASRSYWARGKIKVQGTWGDWHGIRGTGERRPIEWDPPLYGSYPTRALANAAAEAWENGRGGYLSTQIAKTGW